MGQITVFSGPERRRRWSQDERGLILAEAFSPGACVAEVARRHDVSTAPVYTWRRKLLEVAGDPDFASTDDPGFAEATMIDDREGGSAQHRPVMIVDLARDRRTHKDRCRRFDNASHRHSIHDKTADRNFPCHFTGSRPNLPSVERNDFPDTDSRTPDLTGRISDPASVDAVLLQRYTFRARAYFLRADDIGETNCRNRYRKRVRRVLRIPPCLCSALEWRKAMQCVFRLALFLAIIWSCVHATTALAHRVALVIGNDQYLHVGQLRNAARDAVLIGRTVKDIGFTDVRVIQNASNERLRIELEEFYRRASGAEVAFIYFAGHGYTLPDQTVSDFENGYVGYITGIDWKNNTSSGIAIANTLLAAQSASRIVVVIDACRTYFQYVPGQTNLILRNISTRIPGARQGLEPMKQDNLFFAASTWNGTPALDGVNGANSKFAVVLADLIRRQRAGEPGFGASLSDIVKSRTSGDQVPFVFSNLPTSGNPLRIDDAPGAAANLVRPALELSMNVPGVSDAVMNDQGRVLALHSGSVTDGTGRIVRRADRGNRVLALSRSGSRLLVADGNRVYISSPRGGSSRSNPLKGKVQSSYVTDDGSYLATLDTGIVIGRNSLYPGFWPKIDLGPISSTFIPDNDYFAYFATQDRQFCLYKIPLWKAWCRQSWRPVVQVVESPKGTSIITVDDVGRAELRTSNGGDLITELRHVGGRVTCADFSRNGRLIAVGSDNGLITIWDAGAADIVNRIGSNSNGVKSVHFSGDGSKIVVARENGAVEVWRIAAKQ